MFLTHARPCIWLSATCGARWVAQLSSAAPGTTNPVVASGLRLTQRHISRTDEFRQRSPRMIENSNANRDCEPKYKACTTTVFDSNRLSRNAISELFRETTSLHFADARKEDSKLFGAEPPDKAQPTQILGESRCYPTQYLVSGLVSCGFTHTIEMIYLNHYEGERSTTADGAHKLNLRLAAPCFSIKNAGLNIHSNLCDQLGLH